MAEDKIDLGRDFSAMAVMIEINPEMFEALSRYWGKAAQQTPPRNSQAHSMNSQPAAEFPQITRNR